MIANDDSGAAWVLALQHTPTICYQDWANPSNFNEHRPPQFEKHICHIDSYVLLLWQPGWLSTV